MIGILDSVNIGTSQPNPHTSAPSTGIDKQPTAGPLEVRAPGTKRDGHGSGLVRDFVGDRRHHGGDDQALYAFQREDLDRWQERLGRDIPNGFFGENLTTTGIDVNEARIGETWQIGDTVRVQVVEPRLPCNTFRGWVGEKGWLRTFTLDARPGAYLRILVPGFIEQGDEVHVIDRPDHAVTISLVYRATTTQRDLLPGLLAAGDDLTDELRDVVKGGKLVRLG